MSELELDLSRAEVVKSIYDDILNLSDKQKAEYILRLIEYIDDGVPYQDIINLSKEVKSEL